MPSMNFTMLFDEDCSGTGFDFAESLFSLVYATFSKVARVKHTLDVEDVNNVVEMVSPISLII